MWNFVELFSAATTGHGQLADGFSCFSTIQDSDGGTDRQTDIDCRVLSAKFYAWRDFSLQLVELHSLAEYQEHRHLV